MNARFLSPLLALAGLGASFAFMSTVVTTSAGCDPVDGGPTTSGGSTDAGEGGTTTSADAGLVWGCSDNGTQCKLLLAGHAGVHADLLHRVLVLRCHRQPEPARLPVHERQRLLLERPLRRPASRSAPERPKARSPSDLPFF